MREVLIPIQLWVLDVTYQSNNNGYAIVLFNTFIIDSTSTLLFPHEKIKSIKDFISSNLCQT